MTINLVFIDELTELQLGDTVTFGRAADIVVDDNPYMHRIVGTVFDRDGVWWVANNAKHAALVVRGSSGRMTRLPPEAVGTLAESTGVISFEFGPSNYELGWALPGQDPLLPPLSDTLADAPETTQFGVIPLNAEQKLLLLALAEHALNDPAAEVTDLPANASVAHRLGWSTKKLDRKLDYLCARLATEGVRGLRGEKGFEATDRRTRLVEHVVGTGMVHRDELDLLP